MSSRIPDEYECSGTGDPVCPYCGGEQSDFWEVHADDGDTECGHCGRTFRYQRIVEVTYTTEPIMGPHRLDGFWQAEDAEAFPLMREEPCDYCHGVGKIGIPSGPCVAMRRCSACGGTGKRLR